MKIIALICLILAFSQINCGCPFAESKDLQFDRPDYLINSQKVICENEDHVAIDGVCQKNDLELSSGKQYLDFTKDCFISWSFPDDKSIDIVINLKLKNWVGLSFENGMKHGDMVIFEIDDFGQVKGWVSWSVGKVKPKPYKDQSMLKVLGYKVDHKSLKIKFNRLIDTGIKHWAVLKPGSLQKFSIAYNKPGLFTHMVRHNVKKEKRFILTGNSLQEEQQEEENQNFIEDIQDQFMNVARNFLGNL